MKLVLVATGGTIASLPDSDSGAVRPAVGPADLLDSMMVADDVEIEPVEIERVNGWNVTPAMMYAIAAKLRERLDDPAVNGAVVTHGTDTIEESAFLTDVLVETNKPIVFVAAMRTAAELGADGPRNLTNAAKVAGSTEACGWGALVVMNDELHAARWCVKLESFRPSALGSPGRGPVGFVTPERMRIEAPPARFLLPGPASMDVSVPIVTTYTGMAREAIDVVLDQDDVRGLILQGTGAGNVPGSIMPAIADAISAGVVVVIATRTSVGGTVPIYGGPGGGATLREEGVIPAGGLTAGKARLLLMAAMAAARDPTDAVGRFREGVNVLAPGAFGAV